MTINRKYPKEFACNGPLHKLYQTWNTMKHRCKYERSAKWYRDKGIKVCDAWLYWPTFAQFGIDNGWEPGLEIDRIDNSKGYYPENCRFVTHEIQNQNRDLASAHRLIKEAQTKNWAKPFKCVETGEVFECQIQAQRKHGVDRKSLRYALSGKYSQAGGLHWQYLEAS